MDERYHYELPKQDAPQTQRQGSNERQPQPAQQQFENPYGLRYQRRSQARDRQQTQVAGDSRTLRPLRAEAVVSLAAGAVALVLVFITSLSGLAWAPAVVGMAFSVVALVNTILEKRAGIGLAAFSVVINAVVMVILVVSMVR